MDPIVDAICRYFGGPYDPVERAYLASTIPGVAQFRRGWDKLDDFGEYFRGMPPGSAVGCQAVVTVTRGIERRLTFPAVYGRKHNTLQISMYFYFWSSAQYVEDLQDAVADVRQATIALLRADPTVGTGGFEAGFFQVGMPDEHGSGGDIDWVQSVPVTVDRQTSKQGLTIEFEAHEIPVG
jgi:hypothetical protein